jgi:hypothetical protein
MAYATLEDVRGMTTFPEVASLSDDKLQAYIDRASAWIRRDTGQSFEGETDSDILLDLRIATTLLVEYLWYWDQTDVKDGLMSNAESERIGSYSYNKKAVPGESTGNKELDSILASLRVSDANGLFLFSVSGPSRYKK